VIVIPIPKIQGTIRVNEFRPINKLPVYEKILEMVHRQLVEYLKRNKFIIDCQSGFRSRRSCKTALQWILSDWKNAIGEKLMIRMILLDLKWAFEVIDRKVLINKLQRYRLEELRFWNGSNVT